MYMKKIQLYSHRCVVGKGKYTHTKSERMLKSPRFSGSYFENCYSRISNSHNSVRKGIDFNRIKKKKWPQDKKKQHS